MEHLTRALAGAAGLLFATAGATQDSPSRGSALAPYSGPRPESRVVDSLHRRVMTGYQGWFMAHGDGYGAGFVHWGGVDRDPPTCTVDMWPDLTEYGEDERYPTGYRHADGTVAEVFSSTNRKTVLRHFRWMREYDIDGAFVQRFAAEIRPGQPDHWTYRRTNAVLAHCREGANTYGRGYAVMYDMHFDAPACERVQADWARLREEMQIGNTPAYAHHAGGPVLALWGFGFRHRRFDPDAAAELLEFLTAPEQGGCKLLLGVPNDWASWKDERRELLEAHATVISPWNVGRYDSDETADAHFARRWPGDLALCEELGKDYYAVVFPGFSWTNLREGKTPLDQIPRRGGRFYWHQIEQVHRYGMDMVYVAMFDEVDEGTAIFKVTNDPPVGSFVTFEGLPSDHYLELTRQARRLLRGLEPRLPDDWQR